MQQLEQCKVNERAKILAVSEPGKEFTINGLKGKETGVFLLTQEVSKKRRQGCMAPINGK